MIGDPRDKTAFSIAIASLGLALAIALIGVCWLATERGSTTEITISKCPKSSPAKCKSGLSIEHASSGPDVPPGLWLTLVSLGGIFAGTLIPFPLPAWSSTSRDVARDCCSVFWNGMRTLGFFTLLAAGLLVVILARDDSLAACAVGGLLFGLLIPSPLREA